MLKNTEALKIKYMITKEEKKRKKISILVNQLGQEWKYLNLEKSLFSLNNDLIRLAAKNNIVIEEKNEILQKIQKNFIPGEFVISLRPYFLGYSIKSVKKEVKNAELEICPAFYFLYFVITNFNKINENFIYRTYYLNSTFLKKEKWILIKISKENKRIFITQDQKKNWEIIGIPVMITIK